MIRMPTGHTLELALSLTIIFIRVPASVTPLAGILCRDFDHTPAFVLQHLIQLPPPGS